MNSNYTPAQLKATRKAILNTFKNCYAGEDRASYLKGTEEEKIALKLCEEGKLVKSRMNADTGGIGDKRYTYFCPLFHTFTYERFVLGIKVPPDERMKNWK